MKKPCAVTLATYVSLVRSSLAVMRRAGDSSTRIASRLVLAVALLAAGVGTAACGFDDNRASSGGGHMSSTTPEMSSTPTGRASIAPGPPAQGAHNQADVDFAAGMIPHHGQAIQMADMILVVAGSPEIKALAQKIKAAQAPEIATMAGWLKGWQAAVPDPFATDAMSGMHGGHMMSADDMAQMGAARGSAADRMFLTMMPEHHEGAIAMAQDELTAGANPTAKALAQKIIDDQTAEIAEMKAMLAALG
jgi:uncharacterized protein (DUF305 family)